ncbi:hypothetical protein HPB52_007926 [Rhipicephalus sanguineus]|uniref:Uncharacterized protein n=1 Tax=Rhipicephalus sanguineus TaxID=34632 RepID=A0A9D4SU38_RHISA|nr:hypothetical protein HPB52_007926 [Rhipicephalus sanguineus]
MVFFCLARQAQEFRQSCGCRTEGPLSGFNPCKFHKPRVAPWRYYQPRMSEDKQLPKFDWSRSLRVSSCSHQAEQLCLIQIRVLTKFRPKLQKISHVLRDRGISEHLDLLTLPWTTMLVPRQLDYYVVNRNELPFPSAQKKFLQDLRLASQTADFLWGNVIVQLPRNKHRSPGQGQEVKVLGDASIPKNVADLLKLGPKFCEHPDLDKTELLSLVMVPMRVDLAIRSSDPPGSIPAAARVTAVLLLGIEWLGQEVQCEECKVLVR